MRKLQYYTLRIFLVTMFVCAGLFLTMVWTAPQNGPDNFVLLPRFVATFFVTGLASFLVWIVTIISELRNKLHN